MIAFEYIIDAAGTLIYPAVLPVSQISYQQSAPSNAQVTLIFYNQIQIDPDTNIITPIIPVTSGLSGTITLNARTSPDSVWSPIQNGALDISTGANMAFPSGAIGQIQAVCAGVAGCAYVLVRLDRGS